MVTVNGLKILENEAAEQVLIVAAQRDPARFAELYESNFHRVYAFISRRTASRQDAEDVTAEVFQEALRNLKHFEWRGLPFASWLLGIAAHRLTDRWRRLGKQQTSLGDWPAPSGPHELNRDQARCDRTVVDPASVGVRVTDSKIEERAMLYQLVDELPPDQSRVILDRFVHQKSVREIALELGRSEGAVKQLQFRALQRLRARIGGSDVEPVRS